MEITIDQIKKEHAKVAQMIATFEANQKIASAYPITINLPELKAGEKYVGAIISADGTKRDHIILLPETKVDINWKDAMAWAQSIGGDLPNRCESALLFATMKDQFEPQWHWTNEQHAGSSGYAWMQTFSGGTQDNYHESYEGRARAVRRLLIIE
ncbi:DUF1566 domain-containing protein [Undibacterium macrobrachii]|uniref:DUF1566 domain-containing protein n=1 Tax=Undibacterium macrobrachii TaxID=1119058 RepID=A0ABQ2X6R5_9BURK|nr:DUF1566 domain-containing protein [Undibacterium macrobrachii]GGX01670.1 hypothetical protein GCM10011282_04520 [Undibacterium macrobrachii]